MKTKTKKAISLIVLVITIIVLAILAATVILTITNTGLINSAKDAINKAELKQVEKIANLAWSEAYVDGKRGQTELEDYVLDMLEKNNINIGKYVIIVTTEGVTVKFDVSGGTGEEELMPGLYEAGAIALYNEQGSNAIDGMLLISWDELVASGAIVVDNGTMSVGTVLPDNMTAKNKYGFYYGVIYDNSDFGVGFAFFEDGSADVYDNGEVVDSLPAGTAVYSDENGQTTITFEGVFTVSPDGTNLTAENGVSLTIAGAEPASFAGDLVILNDGSITAINSDAFVGQADLTGIAIPDSVTAIGQSTSDISLFVSFATPGMFDGCDSLTTVSFGENSQLTTIGEYTFSNCANLTNINIPDSVTYIGQQAFYCCGGLTSIKIPDGVTSIEDEMFAYCTNLTSVTFGENSQLTTIGWHAFYYCENLAGFEIPDSVTSIGNSAFLACVSLTSIKIPDSVTSIDNAAFGGCTGLTNLTFAEGTQLTVIHDSVFSDCTSLVSVTIPVGVTSIGDYAFDGCTSLESVDIPASITSLGDQAFDHCSALAIVTIRATTVPACGTSALPNTLVTIYVPAETISQYNSTSPWLNYASKIKALPTT